MKKRTVALLLVVTLILSSVITGTVAWLVAHSEPVTNTFTVGKVDISLQEHEYDPETETLTDNLVQENHYPELVPGGTYPKDPFVTVKANSAKCYVFIQTPMDDTYRSIDGEMIPSIEWAVDSSDDPTEGWVEYIPWMANGVHTMNRITEDPNDTRVATTGRAMVWSYWGLLGITIGDTDYGRLRSIRIGDDDRFADVEFYGNLWLLRDTEFELEGTPDTGEDFVVAVSHASETECYYTVVLRDGAEGERVNIELLDSWVTHDGRHIHYRVVDKSTEDQDLYILKDDQFTVDENITVIGEYLSGSDQVDYGLAFQAIAIQYDYIQADEDHGRSAVDMAYLLAQDTLGPEHWLNTH